MVIPATKRSLTRRRPRLSEDEMVERYVKRGESRTLIALRAKVPDYHVEAVLVARGVRMRGPAEAVRLAMRQRAERLRTV